DRGVTFPARRPDHQRRVRHLDVGEALGVQAEHVAAIGIPVQPPEQGRPQAGVLDGVALVPELALTVDADPRVADPREERGVVLVGRRQGAWPRAEVKAWMRSFT